MADLGIGTILALVATAASTGYSAVQQAKQKKAIRDQQRQSQARIIEFRPSGSGQDIGVAYGRCAVRGLLVYANANHYYVPDGLLRGHVLGSVADNYENNPENQCLVTQNVLSAGDINAVRWIWLDDVDYNKGRRNGVNVHEWRRGGEASAWITNQNNGTTVEARKGRTKSDRRTVSNPRRTERTANTKFTGLSYISDIYQLDVDGRPPWRGKPIPLFFLEGRTLRTIGEAAGVYTLPMVEVFDSNAVKEFLDYLTKNSGNNGMYGPGLPDVRIDLPTWYASQQIADVVAQGIGSRNTNLYPPELAMLLNLSALPDPRRIALQAKIDAGTLTYADVFSIHNGPRGTAAGLGPRPDARIFRGVALPPGFKRHEGNGVISTLRDYRSIIAGFKEVMPGAEFFPDKRGKFKLRLQDSETAESNQVDMTITPDRYASRLTITYPDIKNVINQCRVRFANYAKDFALDDLTFPRTGSPLHNQLKALDGGRILKDTIDAELCSNEYQARSLAYSRVRLSRARRFQFTVPHIGLALEPGDILDLQDPDKGTHVAYALIKRITPDERWYFQIEAIEFDKDDYAWVVDDEEPIEDLTPVEPEFGNPTNVMLAYTQSENVAVVTWDDAVASQDLATYEIGQQEVGVDTEIVSVGRVSAYGETRFSYRPKFKDSTYRFAVRSVGVSGAVGDWVRTAPLRIDAQLETVEGATFYFGALLPGACPPSSPGKFGDLFIQSNGGSIWQYGDTLQNDDPNGVVVRMDNVAFNYSAANSQWRATPNAAVGDAFTKSPGTFVSGLAFGDSAVVNSITLDPLLAPTNTRQDTTTTPDTPEAADGTAGQVFRTRDLQWWARGTGIFEDSVGTDTGIIGRIAKGTSWDAPNNRFVFFFSSSDPSNAIFVPEEYRATPDDGAAMHLGELHLGSNGSITLQFNRVPTPPFEQEDLINRLENGDLALAMRKGSSGAWTVSQLSPADSDDPYIWTDSGATWTAFLATLSRTQGEQVQIVLLDLSQRAPNLQAAANNPWFRQTQAQITKNFTDELDGNLVLAWQESEAAGLFQTPIADTPTGSWVSPYQWVPRVNLGAATTLSKTAASAMRRVWIIDARRRCRNDVASPWLPYDFTAGADGLGIERIYRTTETDVAPTLPAGANDWAYDSPVDPWFDGIPADFSAMKPYVWRAQRGVPGLPATSDPKQDDWSDWRIDPRPSQVWGQDGEPGVAGIPGMSRIMRMDTRVDVMPNAMPTDPNPTNPNSNGEYAFLRRRPGATGTTTQLDIANWDGLYDRPGDNENLTLRLARWDKDGADWREYLREVPKGGVITFFPAVQADGSLDTSAWIDFTIERAGAVRDFEEDAEGAFVGFHIERIERVTKDGITWPPAFNSKVEVAFGFSWAGANATVLQEDETYYRRAATRPNPPPDSQTFGTTPTGWATVAQMPTVNDAVWRANRSRLGGENGDWIVVEHLPTVDREYATVYRRLSQFLQPNTPISSPTWGVVPSGWTNVRPTATKTLAVWATTRWRDRNRIEPWAKPTVYFQQLPPDTVFESLFVIGLVLGTWGPSPRGANYRQISFRAGAGGGDGGPYEYAFGNGRPFTPTRTVSYSWPFRAGRVESFVIRARDSSGNIATRRVFTPAMTT